MRSAVRPRVEPPTGADAVGIASHPPGRLTTRFVVMAATFLAVFVAAYAQGWDCVIAVAALTSSGARASYSNYGATTVDLGAPGSGIYSTLPGKNGASTYGSYSGTSMATPHVTGAAALYAASHSGASAWQIKDAILNAAVATASMSGKTVTGGRLNVSGF